MKNSISQFLFGASQFFKTSPNAIAYHEVFPKQHLLSLFYSREDLKRKEGESEEAAQKKSEERIEKINQLLGSFATNPSEEAQPNYSDEAVNVINGYQQLAVDRAVGKVSENDLPGRTSSLNNNFSKFIDKNPAPLGGLLQMAAGKAVTKVSERVAKTAVGKGISATLATVGSVVPVLGTAAGYLLGEAGGWLLSRAMVGIRKNSGKVLAGLGIFGGFLVGGPIGAIAGGILGAVSAGVDWEKIGKRALDALTVILAFYFGVFIIPLVLTLLIGPIVVVIILFIINSGAYIVPPAPSISGLPETGTVVNIASPYIDIQKTAAPGGPFKNSDLQTGLKIKYTVRIRPKKGALTNLKFENKCQAIRKAGITGCEAPIPDKEKDKVPDSLDPGNTFEFSYTSTYTPGVFDDSLVLDTFQVTTDALPEKTGAVAAASAVVIIGNPPTACFTFAQGWSPSGIAMETKTIAKMISQQPVYMAKLCAGGTIPLYYRGRSPEGYGGCAGECDGYGTITIYEQGIVTEGSAFYTLTHESGHIFSGRYGTIYRKFQDTVPYVLPCTYGFTPGSVVGEAFAESIALYYGSIPARYSCLGGSFQSAYPAMWQFMDTYVFK